MIKKIIGFIIIAVAISIIILLFVEYSKGKPSSILNNVTLKHNSSGISKISPLEGEKLSYIIKYLWIIPLGTVDIETGNIADYENRKAYPLVASGRVSNFISTFVKAEGVIRSYVDTDTLHTWRYEEKSQAEGHRPSNKVILYDQIANIMEYKNIKRSIPANTQDPLSALFYLRWQPYQDNSDIKFNINSNKDNYDLETKFLRKESIKLQSGMAELLLLQSNIRSQKGYSRSEAKIITYLTDDASRTPVLLKIRTIFGPLVVRLTGVEYK
ncbi:MAG: hypothetical protein COS99_07105 [Candidatus Omnitrophica bacterium CG07_land_8_20_14_0_80_42_15]|uniref:DUF3108 domain-containing protein n=1 Tax=Candidatus Aquitaenariimonas noxiae TaxID=1974741 RepID=A0A2J0L3L2_9BACT|nr:MAG: hypothetical protein COS99_07105 [Candidatus Omnitrophica bacterium CG07_land_8_20_14_0_80_42_15]